MEAIAKEAAIKNERRFKHRDLENPKATIYSNEKGKQTDTYCKDMPNVLRSAFSQYSFLSFRQKRCVMIRTTDAVFYTKPNNNPITSINRRLLPP